MTPGCWGARPNSCASNSERRPWTGLSQAGGTGFLLVVSTKQEGRKEMFYLTTHSTYFIYGYMVSDIWLRTILIVRKETRCPHIGYSFWLTARVILYAPSHREDSSYHSFCYTSRAALAGTTKQSNSYISQLTWHYRVRKRIYVSIYIHVSDTHARRHSLWHGK